MIRAIVTGAVMAILAAACTAATPEPPPALPPAAAPAAFDFAAYDRLVGDADIVVFGEDSHRMPAVHQLAAMLFRHLVEERGFRTFVFESAWGVEDALDAFLASDRETLDERESYLLNVFASAPITELLLWARAYNSAHPDDPVRFSGFQPEQPVTDAGALRAFAARAAALDGAALETALAACDLAPGRHESDVAVILAQNVKRRDGRPGYTQAERAACLGGLDAVSASLERGRARLEAQTSPAAVAEAELHVMSIRLFVATLADLLDKFMMKGASAEEVGDLTAAAYTAIDKARFDIFQKLRQTRERRGKTFLWMHNWHAARDAQSIEIVHDGRASRAVSIGERLSEHYGDRLVTTANIVPCEECGEPAGSLEPAFLRRFGARTAVVDFDTAAADLPIHAAGILYAQYHRQVGAYLKDVVLDRNFDGVIYLPDAEALP